MRAFLAAFRPHAADFVAGFCPHAADFVAALLVVLSCSACASCSSGTPPATEEPKPASGDGATGGGSSAVDAAVELFPAGRAPVLVRVELARTPAERSRGLMHRKHLDPEVGMLFLFDQPQQLTFWMRNTYVPLDMIFIESSMRILGIVENAEPLTDTSRSVPGLSQYVLEVNAGFSREHGFAPGTAVRFQGVPGFTAHTQGGAAAAP
jgi:uncharacterized membrane protein (UPF0127 family)